MGDGGRAGERERKREDERGVREREREIKRKREMIKELLHHTPPGFFSPSL